MAKAPTTQRTPTEAAADRRVKALAAADDLTQPMDVPGVRPGNGAPVPSAEDGVQADPSRVGVFEPSVPGQRVASAAGDASPAGTGRPSSLERAANRALVVEAAVLARLVEQDRFDGLVEADSGHIHQVKWLLTQIVGGRDHEGARQLVPTDLIDSLASEVQAWRTDRGVTS